jgi:hypothetical protein
VEWNDTVDRASEKVAATNANRTQTQDKDSDDGFSEDARVTEAEAVIWLPPLGFEPRYYDPELTNGRNGNSKVLAAQSTTYLQVKPARKHSQEVSQRRELAYTGPNRMARLRHRQEEPDDSHHLFGR